MNKQQAIKKLVTAALKNNTHSTGTPCIKFRAAHQGHAAVTNGVWMIFPSMVDLPQELRHLPTGTYKGKTSDLQQESKEFPNIERVMEGAKNGMHPIEWERFEGMPIMVDVKTRSYGDDTTRCRVYRCAEDFQEKAALNLLYYECLDTLFPDAVWKAIDNSSALVLQTQDSVSRTMLDNAVVMPLKVD